MLAAAYAGIVSASIYLAYEVRFDFLVPEQHQQERMRLLPLVVAVKLVGLVSARQIGTLLTYFSIPDLIRLFWAMAGASLFLLLPRTFGWNDFAAPRGVILADFLLCFGSICAGRVVMRLYRERMNDGKKPDIDIPQQRIAIIGAGDAGASLAREFISHPMRGFRPVIFFDDDPAKHGKLVHGVPVLGRAEAIGELTPPPDITKVVIAMPSAPGKRIREIVQLMNQRGYKVETLPSIEQLASGRVTTTRLRPVEIQDLLGREPVRLDAAAIRHLIEGRVVLVTGAGGSIGSELCRQVAALGPSRLLMVEQFEGALFLIEQELNEAGLGSAALPIVADILNRERLESVFARSRPEIVFHAAAHKHVYMMERQPREAFRNNVVGTRAVAELAAAHGTGQFVLISTDKAINPTSVMGATKRLAEIQLQAMQGLGGHATRFMAVRFGNVLGSSGSVVPIFKRQIANGGPVTVTHPEVTRYFMTIPEAVALVLQSAALGKGGEIFVLNMGNPIKIVELAKQMIVLSGLRVGEDIEIKFSGLKPGEKLYEELQHVDEEHTATEHPHIMRFVARSSFQGDIFREVDELQRRGYAVEGSAFKQQLQRLIPEYKPHLD
ncbi:MAG: polysaccharide biosynthesis protein [Verrucomicrobia bacterium]|nr:polysaccharide biosynthesis protein [Verrucomicrobiota bacterium]